MADEGGGQGAGMGQGERIMLRFTITDYVPPTWICERCVCADVRRHEQIFRQRFYSTEHGAAGARRGRRQKRIT